MKKFIYTMGIIAATAFTFSSCQKEQTINEQPSDKLVTITFTAEKAGLDTRTAAVENNTEVSFIWTDDDLTNIKLFTVGEDEEGKEELTVVKNPTITKVSDTQLTVAAKVAPNATYTFRAVLSGKWTNKNHPRLSESQSPTALNYDPTADILISDDKEVSVGAADEGEGTVATDALKMVFRRPIVVNKMTLKNLNVGEAIDKVVISSDKEIAGYVYSDSKTPVGDKKIITLNYNKAVTVPEGGQFPVYFTTIPGTGHSLTVEVTTDQSVYTKSFAEGKSVDFNLGQFTKFNLALPAGVVNTAISLPIEDSMEWAVNETGADGTIALNLADIPVSKDEKKVYSEASNLYLGIDGLKLGSGSNRGSLTTSDLNLSSAFCISVSARAWLNSSNVADVSQVEFLVDGKSVYTSSNLSAGYKTYYFNAPAATANSKITVKIAGKRGYIKDLVIKSGAITPPPVITVSSNNPIAVANTASSQTIEYTIDNPTEATLTAVLKDPSVDWITNIDCYTDGEVAFDVAAQAEGAAARSAVIVLSYEGADDVEITINQAAGPGGATTKSFTINSADVVSNSTYASYTKTVESIGWVITFGGNNKSIGTNKTNRSKCTLSDYSKYAVSPVTTSSIASAFASTTSITNVKKISYTFNGGSNQTSTNVYLLYSADGTNFSQMTLTNGTQGAAISSETEFEFAKCSGYFALLFEATNTSDAWRIDDVNLTFTYEE